MKKTHRFIAMLLLGILLSGMLSTANAGLLWLFPEAKGPGVFQENICHISFGMDLRDIAPQVAGSTKHTFKLDQTGTGFDISGMSEYYVGIDSNYQVDSLGWLFATDSRKTRAESLANFDVITAMLLEKYPDFQRLEGYRWKKGAWDLQLNMAFSGTKDLVATDVYYHEEYQLVIEHYIVQTGKSSFSHVVHFSTDVINTK